MFSEVADQHAPVKRRRVKRTPLPWVNSQISDTMKERDWAHRKARKSNSARHWSMYAKLRNKVNGLVRTAKSNLQNLLPCFECQCWNSTTHERS